MAPEAPHTGQRRGRAIAMTPQETHDFLTTTRTCRVATRGSDGAPHVAPLWFVWDGTALWLNSVTRSRRWADLKRDARVAVVVDAGEEFHELRGVEITGAAEIVGEAPTRAGADPRLAQPEQLFADKYMGGTYLTDGRHGWLRITPRRTVSWDFRKNPALRGRV